MSSWRSLGQVYREEWGCRKVCPKCTEVAKRSVFQVSSYIWRHATTTRFYSLLFTSIHASILQSQLFAHLFIKEMPLECLPVPDPATSTRAHPVWVGSHSNLNHTSLFLSCFLLHLFLSPGLVLSFICFSDISPSKHTSCTFNLNLSFCNYLQGALHIFHLWTKYILFLSQLCLLLI